MNETLLAERRKFIDFLQGDRSGYDYKHYRKYLQTHAATVGFSNLPADEKREVALQFAVSKEDRDSVLNASEQMTAAVDFHNNSIASRSARWRLVEVTLYNYLVKADVDVLINDIHATGLPLIENYIERGREGIESTDPEGIFDYINCTVGSTWVLTGMRLKPFTPSSGTMSELADLCLEILRGNT